MVVPPSDCVFTPDELAPDDESPDAAPDAAPDIDAISPDEPTPDALSPDIDPPDPEDGDPVLAVPPVDAAVFPVDEPEPDVAPVPGGELASEHWQRKKMQQGTITPNRIIASLAPDIDSVAAEAVVIGRRNPLLGI